MEGTTGGEVPDGAGSMNYVQAMKVVAAPLATVLGVVGIVFWFAAGAWVEGIVRAELTAHGVQTTAHGTQLTVHTGRLNQHDEEIEDNEEDIDENRQEFRDFVNEVISKL